MRVTRLAALVLAVLAATAASGSAHPVALTAPTGLHAFLLRADEPLSTRFTRTPSFAWNPVAGATGYQLQLSTSSTFRDNGIVFADNGLTGPVAAPAITLPWITGNPHSLYARVRATLPGTQSPWSAPFGFDMAPPAAPAPLPSYPGLLRWTPVEGATGYEVWLIDVGKHELVTSNVLDERELYTFHQGSSWTGTVRWRIRALRDDVYNQRANRIPAAVAGPWSPVYSSSNAAVPGGPITLLGTVSDVFSNGSSSAPAHRLMPAFLFSGNQTLNGTPAELFRVYVFTDKQCLNPVLVGSATGSPAYAPRPYGALALPTSQAGVQAARSHYLPDLQPGAATQIDFGYDGTVLTLSETSASATPTTQVPGAPGDTGTGAGTTGTTGTAGSGGSPSPGGTSPGGLAFSGNTGAPVDLWDTDWPSAGYYWTVVPVAAVQPGALSTLVRSPGSQAGDTALPVANTTGFTPGDVVTIDSGGTAETATISGVGDGTLTFSGKLAFGHAPGATVGRTGGNTEYVDMELPQDVCAAGRVARFGKDSEPALTAAGQLFATGLSPSGRLTSALHTGTFYGAPLVSWTPALGAEAYEVQWSKTRYPFVAQMDPRSQTKGFLTTGTSAVLPLDRTPGTWWYRVRGFDYSLPTGAQQMSWSQPAQVVVAKPRFRLVGGSASAPAGTSSPSARKTPPVPAGMEHATGDGFSLDVPATWQKVGLKDSVVTFAYEDPLVRNAFHANVNVLRSSGRAGRTFAQWSADLASQLRRLVGRAPSTSVAVLAAGKAVRLSVAASANGRSVQIVQYAVDAGSSAYVVTFECSAASYPAYAATFAKAIASFRIG